VSRQGWQPFSSKLIRLLNHPSVQTFSYEREYDFDEMKWGLKYRVDLNFDRDGGLTALFLHADSCELMCEKLQSAYDRAANGEFDD
jgi:hypothetical protein